MAGEPIPSSTSVELPDDRLPATQVLRAAAEAVLFLTVFGGVWAFAGDLPEWEFVLSLGVALLTGIWVARCVLYRRLSLRPDFVSAGLSGLVLISAIQLVPLPQFLVSVLSPGAAHAHRTFRPAVEEQIVGETTPPAARPAFLPLSLDPSLTRKFLTQTIAILLVYTVCRNWLSSRGAFRRFAWMATTTGFFLSLFAFVQYFTNDQSSVMYWSVETGGSIFGPFVCRNHYPFFLTPCIGLGCGLLFTTDKSAAQSSSSSSADPGFKGVWYDFTAWLGQASQSPRVIGLLGMLSVMILSVPFSLSRGGLLSILLACLVTAYLWRTYSERKVRADRAGVGAVIGLALVAIGLAMFLGWNQVEKRVATLGKSTVLDNRIPLWLDSLRLIPDYPLTGTGSGTFIRAEPMVRTSGDSQIPQENAHNEYIEALVEGGLFRLGLTVLLVYGAIAAAVRGYRRLHGRSTGQLLLGSAFGLITVALHSFGDFGIHVPAVALLIAAIAGYAAAAADDPDYAPTKRTKHGLSGATHAETDLPRSGEHRSRVRAAVVLTGPPALAGLAVVAALAALMAWEFHSWDRAERLRSGAVIVAKETNPARFDRRVEYQKARTRVIPDDPGSFIDLAQAHFDAALDLDKRLESNAAVRHVLEGLKAARTARNLCPVLPQPQLRLGLYKQQQERGNGNWFVAADSAETYFKRVKELIPQDPEAWYAAGVEAYERKAYDQAWEYWKESLRLSPRQLTPILDAVRKNFPIESIRQLFPEDAAILMRAADYLYPNPDTDKVARKPFLDRAEEILKSKSNQSVAELEVLARVYEQKGDKDGALAAWRRAYNADPENVGLRNDFAAWLEGEEMYEEALTHLEWLKAQNAGVSNVQGRIDLANRCKELLKTLDSRRKGR